MDRRGVFRLGAGAVLRTGVAVVERKLIVPDKAAEASHIPSHICRGNIPKKTGTNGQTFPAAYYTAWRIDVEWWDKEFVFMFWPRWNQEIPHWRLRWDTTSQRIHDVARGWEFALGSAETCSKPFLVYADWGKVHLSGGPDHWGTHMWLWYE